MSSSVDFCQYQDLSAKMTKPSLRNTIPSQKGKATKKLSLCDRKCATRTVAMKKRGSRWEGSPRGWAGPPASCTQLVIWDPGPSPLPSSSLSGMQLHYDSVPHWPFGLRCLWCPGLAEAQEGAVNSGKALGPRDLTTVSAKWVRGWAGKLACG